MNKDAIQLLKDLGKTGYKEKVINIADGFSITLKTLTSREDTDVFNVLDGLKGSEFFHNHKVHTLARCVIQINEFRFDIESDLKVKETKETSEAKSLTEDEKEKIIKKAIEKRKEEMIAEKVKIISDWPSRIIDELYKGYSILVGNAETEVSDDELEETKDNINKLSKDKDKKKKRK